MTKKTVVSLSRKHYHVLMSKFLCICLSPAVQRTVVFENFQKNTVNRSESYRTDASGKAINSARVLNQLEEGCASVICPAGKENKAQFASLAEKDSLNAIITETPGRTRECWTLLDKFSHSTTELVVGEPDDGLDFSQAQSELMETIEKELDSCQAVLIAGSCPAHFSKELPAIIAKTAERKNRTILADYCGDSLLRTLDLCIPDIIKINEAEFLGTFGFGTFTEEETLKMLVTEKSRVLNNMIIITRGAKSTFAAEKGNFTEFPAEHIKAVNTTACGDSFSAGFLHEFIGGGTFEEALAKGTWCAARNAESEIPGSIRKD